MYRVLSCGRIALAAHRAHKAVRRAERAVAIRLREHAEAIVRAAIVGSKARGGRVALARALEQARSARVAAEWQTRFVPAQVAAGDAQLGAKPATDIHPAAGRQREAIDFRDVRKDIAG